MTEAIDTATANREDQPTRNDTTSLADVIRSARTRLKEVGFDQQGRLARQLACQILGLSAEDILRHPERPVSATQLAAVERALERMCSGEPLSRIVGYRSFYGRDFEISPATLDPRADSEVVVEAAIKIASELQRSKGEISFLDIGTGSGCLAVTLAAEVPHSYGLASDISSQALGVARKNATRHAVAERLEFIEADGVPPIFKKPDIVIANPPYIPSQDVVNLPGNVRKYDPLAALDGGADGLSYYRIWLDELMRTAPQAVLVFEVGINQHASVRKLIAATRVGKTSTIPDLNGVERCVIYLPEPAFSGVI
ncbi:MAG: peptide chain release factor N(5)-glutamine methyltransferase [Pseudomonadota bacterium]